MHGLKQTLQGMLESIAADENTGAALVAMSKWAAHRCLLPSPGGAGAGADTSAGAGAGGESVSPLFDSAALPAVLERLLLMATATAATGAGNGQLCASGGDQRQQGSAAGAGGSRGEDGCGSGGSGSGEEELLEEAKAGLEELLRWALPSLVGVVWWMCVRL